MFAMFRKSPIKKLEKSYAAKLAEARDAQRSGNIETFAMLTEEAEKIQGEIDKQKAVL